MKIKNLIERIKETLTLENLSKTFFIGTSSLIFFLPQKGNAQMDAFGNIHIKNQALDSVRVAAATNSDSTNKFTDEYGGFSANFPNTPVGAEERFYFRKQIGSTVFKGKVRDPVGEANIAEIPDLWLYDSTAEPIRTFNLFTVVDTSSLDSLHKLTGIVKNKRTAEACTMYVDTSNFYEWRNNQWILQPHYFDVYIPISGNNNDTFSLTLQKIDSNITYKTVIENVVYDYSKYWDAIVKERSGGNPAYAQYDTAWFPLESIVGLVEEQKCQTTINQKFKVYPTVGSKFNIAGTSDFSIYNVAGQEFGNYKQNLTTTQTYDFDLPKGIYFLKSKEGEVEKIVKTR